MASRVDSFSIQKTKIELSIRDFGNKTISGSAVHKIKFKLKTNYIQLDLRQLQVDTVKNGSNLLIYSHQKEQLVIQLDKIYNNGDSTEIQIFYQGTPAADPGGWGGFYFSGDYAFNLGVGFTVSPHSFGRAWYPCVDEFQMKSAYEFVIETDSQYTAACNGILLSNTKFGSKRKWHYIENIPMSAYLVSVSVSRFSIIESQYKGIENNFPIALYCRDIDSSKVKTSFVNLPQAIQAFETAFGPQIYSKVGYNFVPFNGGAMEHAGNITYPNAYATGNTDYEKIMAHEVAHHWWGNNVTCKTEGDMWLNEGWASYCEHFFMQKLYGDSAYRKSILDNHSRVLRFAHINDGEIFSMIDIPKENTYGNHVYKKGADVIHSLRNVLGDSVFFKSCKAYHKVYQTKNASSKDLENVFSDNGGGARARDFFENWVYEKGSPHVIIKKQIHNGNGPFQLKIFTEQNPRFTNKFYRNLPIEVFFFKDFNNYEKRTIVLMDQYDSFEFTFAFKPIFVCLDYDEKLSDAITDRSVITEKNGNFDLPETLSKLIINKNINTSLYRVEHHWVGPEKYRIKAPYMSDYRYYTLDGIWSDSVSLDLELSYDGRQGGPNSNTGYLDHTLIYKTEDSLTVLYRAFPGDYWRPWPKLIFSSGSKNDKQGKVIIKDASKGDYVFAMYDYSLSIGQDAFKQSESIWSLSPNPSENVLNIKFENSNEGLIEIYNSNGQIVFSKPRQIDLNNMHIDIKHLVAGVYTVQYEYLGLVLSERLVISH